MRALLVPLAALLLPAAAAAADGTYTFHLAQDPANLPDCIAMAPSFELPYTLTMSGGIGTLTSSGGINITMSPSSADKYHGVFELSGERLDYTAVLGPTTTLSVVGNNLGCRWLANAD